MVRGEPWQYTPGTGVNGEARRIELPEWQWVAVFKSIDSARKNRRRQKLGSMDSGLQHCIRPEPPQPSAPCLAHQRPIDRGVSGVGPCEPCESLGGSFVIHLRGMIERRYRWLKNMNSKILHASGCLLIKTGNKSAI